jgi:hypothetical protein
LLDSENGRNREEEGENLFVGASAEDDDVLRDEEFDEEQMAKQ